MVTIFEKGYDLKHRDELLQQIGTGLKEHDRVSVVNLKVTFVDGSDRYEFSLHSALDAIALDLYWDDRGNWANARIAEVDTF